MSLKSVEVLGHILHPGSNTNIGTRILVWALMAVPPHPNDILGHQCGPGRWYTHCGIQYQYEGRWAIMQ
eukprot:6260784-Pyramimonas_sp.AAC.1